MGKETVTPEIIGRYWMQLEKKGTVGIQPIMDSISQEFGSFDEVSLTSQILRTPTESHLYPGTHEVIDNLLDQGDRIVIWTQGDPKLQSWKIATSGLSNLRKGEKAHNRSNFIFFAAEDKIPAIPEIISKYSPTKTDLAGSFFFRGAVIVDDKAHNIVDAQKIVSESRKAGVLPTAEQLPVNFVWMRHELGRSKDVLPEGVNIDALLNTCSVARDPQDLLAIRERQDRNKNLLWLLDVDHTILHTSGWRNNHYQTIAEALNQQI